VSATLPNSSVIPPSPPRSHALAIALVIYVAVLGAAFITGRAWLDELAAFMLVTLLLWPGLRRGSIAAALLWLIAAIGIAALALTGRGKLALDFMPVMVNAALCTLFARSLAGGREPLIARLIATLESPARLTLPRVADYARHLTWAWALLLGGQALLLAVLIVCAIPDGLLASFGVAAPIEVTGHAWRWYLHLGSYTTVLAFLLLEYAYRRWHLRHIPHASLPMFVTRLARRWPALARSFLDDVPARPEI
jgi:uncharacterized membrane protein